MYSGIVSCVAGTLTDLIEGVRANYRRQHLNNFSSALIGPYSAVVPVGTDDGNTIALLWIVNAHYETRDSFNPELFRVVVSAASGGFGDVLRPPVYGPVDNDWLKYLGDCTKTRTLFAGVPSTFQERLANDLCRTFSDYPLEVESGGQLSFKINVPYRS